MTELQDAVLVLGSMAEKAIVDAMAALRNADEAASHRLIDEDLNINKKRFAIEDRAMFVVASQQPMASDLRALASILYVVTDLERIADHAEGIARINLMLGPEPTPRKLGYLPAMADRAVAMLRDSLKAYIDHDVDLARRTCDADDEVDRLQDTVYDEGIKAMMADGSTIQRHTFLLWCAHNLERIADRTTNICERVVYVATGHMEEIRGSHY